MNITSERSDLDVAYGGSRLRAFWAQTFSKTSSIFIVDRYCIILDALDALDCTMRDCPSVLVSVSNVRCYGVPTAPSSTSAQGIDNRSLDDSNPHIPAQGGTRNGGAWRNI